MKYLLKITIVLTVLLMYSGSAFSQKKPVETEKISVFSISAGYNYHITDGDLVKRFGNASGIGGAFNYKTTSNLMFTLEYQFLFTDNFKEESILDKITASSGHPIGAEGTFEVVNPGMRGHLFMFKAGKVFPLFGPNENSGLLAQVGASFFTHRIYFDYAGNRVPPQLAGDYEKGYDRKTNGFGTNQTLGYYHMGNNNLLNFFIGVEFTQSFTQNRRAYNFDTMERDDSRRVDLTHSLKAAIYFPIYRGVVDDDYFFR